MLSDFSDFSPGISGLRTGLVVVKDTIENRYCMYEN